MTMIVLSLRKNFLLKNQITAAFVVDRSIALMILNFDGGTKVRTYVVRAKFTHLDAIMRSNVLDKPSRADGLKPTSSVEMSKTS